MRRLLLALCLFAAPLASADAYKSKVYLDPDKQLLQSISQSLEEMEASYKNLGDAYSKASVGRHLARSYVAEKNYPKAIEFYRQALAAEGLAEQANIEMLVELAGVYLLQKDYPQAQASIARLRKLTADLPPDALLVEARAQSALGQHLAVVKTLEPLLKNRAGLQEPQLQMALSLYYSAGAYQQCVLLLDQLIAINSEELDYWRQQAAIYLAQNNYKAALDRLELARQKKLHLLGKDLMLLADLYIAQNAPEKGARLLEQAIAEGVIDDNEANNKKLFEAWLHAREKKRAQSALQKTVKLSNDTGLWLHLAQLQMEDSNWAGMEATLNSACDAIIADRYVSRANLLLGVSQLKQGKKTQARRAFINATLIGGETEKALQWLSFMEAAPAEQDEMRKITAPCRPRDASVRVATVRVRAEQSAGAVKKTEKEPQATAVRLAVKTVEPLKLYAINTSAPASTLAEKVRTSATRMAVSLVKSGGSMDGALHVLYDDQPGATELELQIGFPYRGVPRAGGQYKLLSEEPFKCVYSQYQGPAEALPSIWNQLVASAESAGMTVTGKRRLILERGSGNGQVNAELQLGVVEQVK